MARYRLAIFDFDGTLADSLAWMTGAFNDAAERFGLRRLAAEEIEALRGEDNRAIARHLGIPFWKIPLLARHMRLLSLRDAGAIPLFADAAPTLRTLSASGMTLAIVTSNGEATVRRMLGPDTAGLVAHFACKASIFGKAGKFRRVLRASGVAPDQAVAIGDETRDIEAAREAGIAAGAVCWGFAAPSLLRRHAPDHLFERFDDIVRILSD